VNSHRRRFLLGVLAVLLGLLALGFYVFVFADVLGGA
jgi:hypothetical protein